MASNPVKTPAKAGLSLYANLLDPESQTPGSISKAPVLNKSDAQDGHSAANKQAAAFRFQPTKRPQLLNQKQKIKAAFPKVFPSSSTTNTSSPDKPLPPDQPPPPPAVKGSIADWTRDDDDDDINGFYVAEKRKRGGRKKRKKAKEEPIPQDWDDIYDPARPNNYEEYKHSDEWYREIREWKDRLYAHRAKRHRARTSDSLSEEERGRTRTRTGSTLLAKLGRDADENVARFAPPTSLNFAPPAMDDGPWLAKPEYRSASPRSMDIDTEDDGQDMHAHEQHWNAATPYPLPPPPPPPPADINMGESGEDAYTWHMRVAQAMQQLPAHFAQFLPSALPPPPPPPPLSGVQQYVPLPSTAVHSAAPSQHPPQPARPLNILDRINASASIAKAPVFFELPEAPSEIPSSEAELERALELEADANENPYGATSAADDNEKEPLARTNRPGQKGFAERLMAKYGYTKGSGLGAQGQGMTTALKVKVDKRKKRPDSEGGGFIGSGAKGTIIAGKKNTAAVGQDGEGKFGPMSEVIVVKGMLAGRDFVKEMEDGSLMQEIGDECAEKYGNIERIYIWREHGAEETSPPVFLKFTAALSALRAVNALDGSVIRTHVVRARFFNGEMFERGEFGAA